MQIQTSLFKYNMNIINHACVYSLVLTRMQSLTIMLCAMQRVTHPPSHTHISQRPWCSRLSWCVYVRHEHV